MFNLIKMDMYRLLHSVSTWVILIFTAAAAVFSVAMTNADIQAAQDAPPQGFVIEEHTEGAEAEAPVGIYVEGNSEWADGDIELGDLISAEIQSGITAVLCVIFAALFANADQKNGFIKNIVGQFPRRGVLILSKFTAIAVCDLVLLAVFSAVTVAFGGILWGDKIYLDALLPLAKVFGVQYLLHLGLSALMMFFTILTRSTAFSMTAGIIICSGLTVFLYSGINQVISGINSKWNFDINRYALESNIKMIGTDTVSDGMLRGGVIGIAFVMISVAFAMVIMKRRDVR